MSLNNHNFRLNSSPLDKNLVIGKLRYMIPLYMGADNNNITKLHRVIMKAARTTIGNYCCKQSINQILDRCKWLPIDLMIKHAAITTLHNIITNKTPKSVTNLLSNTDNTRLTKEITTKYIPRTEKYRRSFLYSGLKIYNSIPKKLKNSSKMISKIKTKNWLKTTSKGVPDTYD